MSPSAASQHGPGQILCGACLAFAIAFSALALGALHTPVLCVIAAVLAIAAFLGWYPASPIRPRLPATILLTSGVLLTTFTALQAMRLPASFVRALSPAAADVWAGALAPLHEPGPAWTSLSLDPIATRVEVLRGVTYVAAFVVALRIAERRRGQRFLSSTIVVTAIALAMAAILHPLLGAERVFGIYKPVAAIPERHIAPLLNANHLAAYINIGFCLALGMALDHRAARYRPLVIAAAALLVATQVWVGSRGGVAALLFGATCVFLTARTSRRFAQSGFDLLVPVAIIGAGLLMLVLGSAPEAAAEIGSLDVSKVRIALSALPLALRYPLFGVGRGAFEVAFPSVRHDDGGYVSFSHPENLPVQWLTEWGIPTALLAFFALVTAMRPRVLATSSSPAIGPWSAIAATAVHNLVDYNSELPAIGIAVAVCAGMLVAGRGTPRNGLIHRWGSHPRTVATGIAFATLASIAVALYGWPHELRQDRTAMYADSAQLAPRDFLKSEREALLHHPSEPYLPFIGAIAASRRHETAIPWVERTLTLAQIYGPAHLILAGELQRRSPAQARLEYRLAMTQDPALAAGALASATTLVATFEDAIELTPSTVGRLEVLRALAGSLTLRLPSTSERLDELSRALDADAMDPLQRVIADTNDDLQEGDAAPWCRDPARCLGTGLAATLHLATLQPGLCAPRFSRARLQVAAGDTAAALHDLQVAAPTATDPPECWRSLGELALAAKSDTYVTAAEDAIARSGCDTDTECASNLAWAASLEERRGNYRRAMVYYARAQEKTPGRGDLGERVAQLASGMGLHAEAMEAYQKLARTGHDAAKWSQLADVERMRALHESSQ